MLDEVRLTQIMTTWPVDILYHAAAYKHVPLVEQNPHEGVSNNVFGTLALALVAERLGLTWYDPDQRYRWHGHEWTFRDYLLKYIRWEPYLR